jgi:polysaccharide biosynthesis/export protein
MRANHVCFLSTLICTAAATAALAGPQIEQHPAPAPPTVLVTGEVRYPGRATLTASTMTVPDALAAVGSPTADAGDDVIVIHAAEPGAPAQGRTINLKDMESGKPGIDATLQDGDIVNVPQGKRYFVSGFVKRPGAYRLRAGTTVSQALLQVGGLLEGANDRRVRIRRVVNGKSIEIAAHEDDRVLPNDEIKVPRRMF